MFPAILVLTVVLWSGSSDSKSLQLKLHPEATARGLVCVDGSPGGYYTQWAMLEFWRV